jgi:hypothetical protein
MGRLKDSKGRFIKQYNKYDLSGSFGIGYTLDGEEFYFDLEDYELIKDYCWFISEKDYICTNTRHKKHLKMHRLVMNAQKNEEVDHKKHNTHDNRKSELRKVTSSQNNMNAKLAKNNSTGYKGITFDIEKNKFRARITCNKKVYHLGYFENIENAIKARDKVEEKQFGEYSYDNSMKDEVVNK